MKEKVAISIFTPVYNRAKTIQATFESLKRQTVKDFEWIVINDGSSDDSEKIKRNFEGGGFPIYYHYQTNQGKHIAQNHALDVARGELFLPLDSDDTVVDDAVETIVNEWNKIKSRLDFAEYSGLGFHCKDETGQIVGTPWPEDHIVSNDLEMYFIYKVRGEKWGPIRTDIMNEFRSPAIKGKFFSESTVWFQIAQKYKKAYINKALRLYEIHADSVSTKKTTIQKLFFNVDSYMAAEVIYLNLFYDWYWKYSRREAIIHPLRLAATAFVNKKPFWCGSEALIKKVKRFFPRLLIAFSYPVLLVVGWVFIHKARKNRWIQ